MNCNERTALQISEVCIVSQVYSLCIIDHHAEHSFAYFFWPQTIAFCMQDAPQLAAWFDFGGSAASCEGTLGPSHQSVCIKRCPGSPPARVWLLRAMWTHTAATDIRVEARLTERYHRVQIKHDSSTVFISPILCNSRFEKDEKNEYFLCSQNC